MYLFQPMLPIPTIPPPPTPEKHTPAVKYNLTHLRNDILNFVTPILFQMILPLTLSIFKGYQEIIQFEFTEAACVPTYNNKKLSKKSNKVKQTIHNEQSAKAPAMSLIISNEAKVFLLKYKVKYPQI